MKSLSSSSYIALPVFLAFSMAIAHAKSNMSDQVVRVSLQKRIPSELEPGAFILVNEVQEWQGKETAIIICDMWDQHWNPFLE